MRAHPFHVFRRFRRWKHEQPRRSDVCVKVLRVYPAVRCVNRQLPFPQKSADVGNMFAQKHSVARSLGLNTKYGSERMILLVDLLLCLLLLLPRCQRGSPLQMAPDCLGSSDGMFPKYCRFVLCVHMVERPFKTFGKGRRLDKLSIT